MENLNLSILYCEVLPLAIPLHHFSLSALPPAISCTFPHSGCGHHAVLEPMRIYGDTHGEHIGKCNRRSTSLADASHWAASHSLA